MTSELKSLFATFLKRYEYQIKESTVWTYESGCLVFTLSVIYHQLIVSSHGTSFTDKLVIALFIFGAVSYFSVRWLMRTFFKSIIIREVLTFFKLQFLINLLNSNRVENIVKWITDYFFILASFVPGLYFAFQYDNFINYVYLVYHFAFATYVLYNKFKHFQPKPFVIGLLLSAVLKCVNPSIRLLFGFSGTGLVSTILHTTFQNTIYVCLAVVFMARLPEKLVSPEIMLGLKIVKYLMFWSQWETWFVIMVFYSWQNIGAVFYATFRHSGNRTQKTSRSQHEN